MEFDFELPILKSQICSTVFHKKAAGNASAGGLRANFLNILLCTDKLVLCVSVRVIYPLSDQTHAQD